MNRLFAVLAIVLITACADRTVTQYVGAAMNEATPEAEGRLTLTVFFRDDTSFSGILEVGTPGIGTGSAYLWHEESQLRMVSVDAADGDTVLWTSNQTNAEIGGKFEVIGGGRVGQGGTWRATLKQGMPVSPLTLESPQHFPLPSLAAMWTVLLVGGLVLLGVSWIRAAPSPTAGDIDTAGAIAIRPIPGGWLAFFMVAQAIGIIVGVVQLFGFVAEFTQSLGATAAIQGGQPLLVAEMSINLLLPVLAIVGLVLMDRRSRLTPRFWFAACGFGAAYLLADSLLAGHVNGELQRLLGADYDGSDVTQAQAKQLGSLLPTIAWMIYWARSKRVRATFGSAALDREWHQATSTAATAPAEPDNTRDVSPSKWRMAGRVAVGLVAVLLVLMGIGLWSNRITPYSVPEGARIQDAVTGRWSWPTESPRCGPAAHVIAFSDSGKVMTISMPGDLGTDTTVVTTYDIVSTTRSTIRGAIRGETRLTEEGKPVVWDLVLVGRDEYRWRRTDWSTPFGATAAVTRCPSVPADSGGA